MKRTYKILAAAVLIIIALLGSYAVTTSFKRETKATYQEFITQLEDKQIKYAEINEDTGRVTYKLKNDNKIYYTAYPDSDYFKQYMLEQGVEIGIKNKDIIGPLGSFLSLAIMVVFIILIYNMVNPANKFKVVNSKDIKTTFKDVAGNDEIKEELILISKMMQDEKYRTNGAKVPKGVLLQGPPGNGKTLLARAFAGETGVNFIAATASDFSSQFVGIGSNKIKQIFKTAKANAPCVIFLDEIDGVGSKRMNVRQAADKEMNTILTALLNEMDGFKNDENIMVLAATNRIDDLDDALTRPGRFDRQFIINKPDKKARIQLLKQYTGESQLDGSVDFDVLANRTYGFSSAQIESLCNEAVLISISENQTEVRQQDFENAILKIAIKGNIKKESLHSDEERRLIAYHEAGHAVMTYYCTDDEVSTITIKPTTSGAGGFTMTAKADENQLKTLDGLYGELKMIYGGRAAEYILADRKLGRVTTGASQDINDATRLAADYVCLADGIDLSVYGETGIEEVMKKSNQLLNKVWEDAVSDTEKHWDKLTLVAKELIEKETITKEEFLKIIN